MFSTLFLLAFLTFPISVEAFSVNSYSNFLSSVFGSALASQEDSSKYSQENSQNMDVLSAQKVKDFQSIGGGSISTEDNVLIASSRVNSNTEADFSVEIPAQDQISIYVVEKGDSLSQIAQDHGVSVNTIKWANDISGSGISIGDELTILPITGVRHIVKSGESLSGIVDKYGGDMTEVLEFNNFERADEINVDEVVVIPNGQVPQSSSGSRQRKETSSQSASPSSAGYYIRPLQGIQGQDWYRSQGLHGYNAVDLAANVGTPIKASAPGQVIISRNSGWNGGYGNYIVIKHSNGTQTLYAHNNRNIVSVGQWVEQGQTIGYVGSTGRSTGPHIHFEIRGATNPF